jgi:hypothetical protein
MVASWTVKEQGGDGAILESEDGSRHFVRGDISATD